MRRRRRKIGLTVQQSAAYNRVDVFRKEGMAIACMEMDAALINNQAGRPAVPTGSRKQAKNIRAEGSWHDSTGLDHRDQS